MHGCDVPQILVVLVVYCYARESCPDVDGDFKFSIFWAEDVIALSDFRRKVRSRYRYILLSGCGSRMWSYRLSL